MVLHQCNIVEFHSRGIIYGGAKGEGNVINLMQFRRNIIFLVYLPHSIATVEIFWEVYRQLPCRQGSSVPAPSGHLFLDVSISSMWGREKGDGRALRPCPCGTALQVLAFFFPPLLNFLRYKMLLLKTGRNMAVLKKKKSVQGLDGSSRPVFLA